MRLRVTDTGPGVAPELHERLFAPFDRLDADAKGIEGTGLGLALSKGLMEAIGGSLGVESEPGEGSTFWLELPLATTSAQFRRSRPATSRHRRPPRLDVAATVCTSRTTSATSACWSDSWCTVPTFDCSPRWRGVSAFELARQHRPDLILLDVHMPDLSGFEVLELLRG